jgi:uncharacterized protein YgbK (DUF1537 family)
MTKTVVLDDDPTGTQTVQDVAVLTVWDTAALQAELLRPEPLFFVLTNTRAMPEPQARRVNAKVCRNLQAASRAVNVNFTLISRSDSTLRGHFPAEPEAIEQALGTPFEAWFLVPFFEEGGRITRDDVHYVREGDTLVPAAETPFAQDATFGYRNSNLRRWVEEKTNGKVQAEEVISLTLNELRNPDPQPLTDKIAALEGGKIVVVNAERWQDLVPLAQIIQALPQKRFLFRTAASWVKVVKYVTDGQEILRPVVFSKKLPETPQTGGLVVVGSYVPKTTQQLAELLRDNPAVVPLEMEVAKLLDEQASQTYVQAVVSQLEDLLRNGKNAVLFTSRTLVKDPDPVRSLEIGNRVSAGLVAVVRQMQTRPRFLIAKGGITSSDVATAGLGVCRAVVLGQLLPGVPVWETGPESRFPGLFYVVFPGNVGDATALRRGFGMLDGSGKSSGVSGQ